MAARDIVTIGASAGGIQAIAQIAKDLPAGLPAAIFVVVHMAPDSPGYLSEILSRWGPLPARAASDGEHIKHGTIYVARPAHHLLLDTDGRMRVTHGPKENRARPAIDPLFRSAALAYGQRVIGIVLSGALNDGTAGLRGIKMCGGTTIVQDPEDAAVPSMPESALRNVTIDYCRPAAELGSLIVQLVRSEIPDRPGPEEDMKKSLEIEVEIAERNGVVPGVMELGEPSVFTCPECHGTLLKLRDERPARYRCHTGHAFTTESLLAELTETTERVLWNAIRAMQETAMLMRHLADHWRQIDPSTADEFRRNADEQHTRADLVRQAVLEKQIKFKT